MAEVDAAVERTAEAEFEAMETALEQAAEFGAQPKSESENGMAGCMRRKFERFLERVGYSKLGYVAGTEPDVGLVRKFVGYCYSGAGREQLFSGVGRKGFADAYFELHLPYTLAQKVFAMMGIEPWPSINERGFSSRRSTPSILVNQVKAPSRRAVPASKVLSAARVQHPVAPEAQNLM